MWWLREPFQIIRDYSFGEYSEMQIELLSWVVTFLWLFFFLLFLPFFLSLSVLPSPSLSLRANLLCSFMPVLLLVWLCCTRFLGLLYRYHELGALQQHRFILWQSWEPEFEIKVSAVCAPSEDSGRQSFSCLFQLLLTPGVPWPVFTSWPRPSSLCLHLHITLSSSLCASYKAHLSVDKGPTPIIHSDLLTQRYLITSANTFFPNKVTVTDRGS